MGVGSAASRLVTACFRRVCSAQKPVPIAFFRGWSVVSSVEGSSAAGGWVFLFYHFTIIGFDWIGLEGKGFG